MYENDRGGFSRGGFAPVKEGEEIEVTIEAVGEKGDGIAKIKGFVIFVPNTQQGDRVKIRISKVLRKVGFGDVIGEASPAPAEESGSEENTEAESTEEAPAEDSEDFGEETEEETSEEEPAQEETEEETPAETEEETSEEEPAQEETEEETPAEEEKKEE